MSTVILNAAQREALSWFFNPDNDEGEPFIEGEAIDFKVDKGIPFVCGAYLWPDGEWATYHPKGSQARRKLSPEERKAITNYDGSATVRDLAIQYGISESYVRLLRGKR